MPQVYAAAARVDATEVATFTWSCATPCDAVVVVARLGVGDAATERVERVEPTPDGKRAITLRFP
ncbi:MAG: hypothetical protein R3F34_09910 [Planctomycetota bacterium]